MLSITIDDWKRLKVSDDWTKRRKKPWRRDDDDADGTTGKSYYLKQMFLLIVSNFSNALLQGIERVVNNRNEPRFLWLITCNNIISEFNPLKHDLDNWLATVDSIIILFFKGTNKSLCCVKCGGSIFGSRVKPGTQSVALRRRIDNPNYSDILKRANNQCNMILLSRVWRFYLRE